MRGFVRQNRLLSFAIGLVAFQVLVALLAPWLGFQDPFRQVMVQRIKPPNALNLLGTDQLGREAANRAIAQALATLPGKLNADAQARLIDQSISTLGKA